MSNKQNDYWPFGSPSDWADKTETHNSGSICQNTSPQQFDEEPQSVSDGSRPAPIDPMTTLVAVPKSSMDHASNTSNSGPVVVNLRQNLASTNPSYRTARHSESPHRNSDAYSQIFAFPQGLFVYNKFNKPECILPLQYEGCTHVILKPPYQEKSFYIPSYVPSDVL